ncbi:MAG: hypothetical protein GY820_36425 [Gammaproteobacteria bacterium]|nr:hypothetical protein [Gammaproteobacteria bacterium]
MQLAVRADIVLDDPMLEAMDSALEENMVLDDPMLEAMSSALEEGMFLDDALLNGINLAVKANVNLDKALLKTIGAASVEEDSPLLDAIQCATQHNIKATKSLINEMALALKYNINLIDFFNKNKQLDNEEITKKLALINKCKNYEKIKDNECVLKFSLFRRGCYKGAKLGAIGKIIQLMMSDKKSSIKFSIDESCAILNGYDLFLMPYV